MDGETAPNPPGDNLMEHSINTQLTTNQTAPKDRTTASLSAWITFFYVLLLAALLASLHWLGERNWVLSILLYLPGYLFFLPLAVLTPICLYSRPKLCFWHLGCVFFTLFFYQTFRWSPAHAPKGATLTVLTNNIANNNNRSLRPFIQAENPDVIAIEDATNRAGSYARQFPDRFVEGCDQFVLISKFPIISASAVQQPGWLGRPVAARYEISVNGESIVIYTIHMPTPRPDFAKLRGFGLLREIFNETGNRKLRDGRSYREAMEARIELARQLAGRFSEEKLPFLLAGDFNMPDHGFIYHLFSSRFTDAFANSGRGWGLTFPGFGSHEFKMPGPWLRIDYIFAGKGWKPVDCRTEPDRRSKHRAVVARLERMGNGE